MPSKSPGEFSSSKKKIGSDNSGGSTSAQSQDVQTDITRQQYEASLYRSNAKLDLVAFASSASGSKDVFYKDVPYKVVDNNQGPSRKTVREVAKKLANERVPKDLRPDEGRPARYSHSGETKKLFMEKARAQQERDLAGSVAATLDQFPGALSDVGSSLQVDANERMREANRNLKDAVKNNPEEHLRKIFDVDSGSSGSSRYSTIRSIDTLSSSRYGTIGSIDSAPESTNSEE